MALQIEGTISYKELCRSKFQVAAVAKAPILLPDDLGLADVMFWWEPSQTKYPQLFCRFTRTLSGNEITESGAMDFYQIER